MYHPISDPGWTWRNQIGFERLAGDLLVSETSIRWINNSQSVKLLATETQAMIERAKTGRQAPERIIFATKIENDWKHLLCWADLHPYLLYMKIP